MLLRCGHLLPRLVSRREELVAEVADALLMLGLWLRRRREIRLWLHSLGLSQLVGSALQGLPFAAVHVRVVVLLGVRLARRHRGVLLRQVAQTARVLPHAALLQRRRLHVWLLLSREDDAARATDRAEVINLAVLLLHLDVLLQKLLFLRVEELLLGGAALLLQAHRLLTLFLSAFHFEFKALN